MRRSTEDEIAKKGAVVHVQQPVALCVLCSLCRCRVGANAAFVAVGGGEAGGWLAGWLAAITCYLAAAVLYPSLPSTSV